MVNKKLDINSQRVFDIASSVKNNQQEPLFTLSEIDKIMSDDFFKKQPELLLAVLSNPEEVQTLSQFQTKKTEILRLIFSEPMIPSTQKALYVVDFLIRSKNKKGEKFFSDKEVFSILRDCSYVVQDNPERIIAIAQNPEELSDIEKAASKSSYFGRAVVDPLPSTLKIEENLKITKKKTKKIDMPHFPDMHNSFFSEVKHSHVGRGPCFSMHTPQIHSGVRQTRSQVSHMHSQTSIIKTLGHLSQVGTRVDAHSTTLSSPSKHNVVRR